MKHVTTFVVALLSCMIATRGAAEESPHEKSDLPKSSQAVAAITKQEAAEKKAEDTYVQTVVTSKRQCIRELDAAIKTALQSGSLDDANKIADFKKKLTAEIDRLVAEGKPSKASAAQIGTGVYLDGVTEEAVSGVQWPLTKKGIIHGMPIVVEKKKYAHGMGLNPIDGKSARITYKLPPHCKSIKGAAGINDSGDAATITFRIIGDGKELWTSKPINAPGMSDSFDVDLTDVKILELVADCPGGAAGAHCVWLDPQLFGTAK